MTLIEALELIADAAREHLEEGGGVSLWADNMREALAKAKIIIAHGDRFFTPYQEELIQNELEAQEER